MSRDGDGDHNPATATPRMAFKTDENGMLNHLDKVRLLSLLIMHKEN
jgi:hypothetical protein